MDTKNKINALDSVKRASLTVWAFNNKHEYVGRTLTRVAEIASADLGFSLTAANMAYIRDACWPEDAAAKRERKMARQADTTAPAHHPMVSESLEQRISAMDDRIESRLQNLEANQKSHEQTFNNMRDAFREVKDRILKLEKRVTKMLDEQGSNSHN